MCGLVGFLSANSFSYEETHATLRNMAIALEHRGPDGEGYWCDLAAGILLAHRRLSILDISTAGAQPMVSASGRYVIAFNGEIYNHKILRHKLDSQGQASVIWKGHSDTETLLACIEAWGIEGALKNSNGMFAMAIWDRSERCLILARDRFGEKPLYYGWQGFGLNAAFVFGSELASLRRHPACGSEIDRHALASYMQHNCIGGEKSIYKGIHKLLPGHLLRVSLKSVDPDITEWWSGVDVVTKGCSNLFKGSPGDAVDALEALLLDSVGQQMIADVPLGAFLSGGVDSSVIVALMQSQASKPVKTFSIGFYEENYNEAKYAKEVARHLGTDHTEMYVTSEHAQSIISKIPTLYSEPFADSSQIPTYLVSQLARQHVTVSLSGDAGDELFCGYSRYQMTARSWKSISRIPLPLRNLMAGLITRISPKSLDRLQLLLPLPNLGERLHKGAALLGCNNVEQLYEGMVSQWREPTKVVLGVSGSTNDRAKYRRHLSCLNDVEQMMAMDMLGYLPDDILVKVDRAAMGVSLETRVPFLDPRVVEFAWSLPFDYRLRKDGEKYMTKWALRQVLYRYVPKTLIERPKMGFGVPIGDWLRGPLREWAEDLLSESRLRTEGYFRPELIRRKWEEHLSGKRNWQHQLWCVLMFQAWLAEQSKPFKLV